MRFNSGAVDFYTNSSLTPGTSYTLTVISTIDASGMTINGSVKIHADNQSLTLGAGDDASIYYDGANLVVDPDVVGSGGVYIAGRLLLPMGEVNYFSTTGTAISIATVSDGSTNMVLVNPTTTLANDSGFDSPSAGRLRYTGAETRMFHVACTISFAPDSANDVFVIGVAKNGTVLPTSKVLQKVSNAADTNSTAMHVMVSLSTNDYLEAYAGNVTDADDFTIKTLTLFAMGM
jgi:hypothetical protein